MRRASMTMWDAMPRPHGVVLPTVEWKALGERLHLLPDAGDYVLTGDVGKHGRDQRTHLAHFRLTEAARGDGGRTQPDPPRGHRRGGVGREGGLFIGGLVSNGMAFWLTVMRARSSASSASLPRSPLEKTSSSTRCVSVPPETTRKPASISASAMTRALATTRF